MDKTVCEVVYDTLYEQALSLLTTYNPCQILDGQCLRGRKKGGENFCCPGCKSLTSTGCSADRPLYCRIWLCDEAWDALPKKIQEEYRGRRQILYRLAGECDLLHFRADRATSLAKCHFCKGG